LDNDNFIPETAQTNMKSLVIAESTPRNDEKLPLSAKAENGHFISEQLKVT
jgi:hypothetical protein